MSEPVLWSDSARGRYFLVPATAVLPEGELELHTALGRRRRVTESSVASFEVPEEQAREWLSGRLSRTAAQLGENLRDGLRRAAASRRQGSPPTGIPESWLEAFGGLGGSGQAPGDSSSAQEGIGQILRELTELAVLSAGDEEISLEASRARAQALGDKLANMGIPVGEVVARLPERVQALYRKAQTEANDPGRRADDLEQIADAVDAAAAGITEKLRAMAAELRQKTPPAPDS